MTMESKSLRCWQCGYDLRATFDGGTCPECGKAVGESRDRRLAQRAVRRRLVAVGWPLLVSFAAAFAFFVVWADRAAIRGFTSFFHSWEWTWRRFFELYWLWLTLPVAGASAALAARRCGGFMRVLLEFWFLAIVLLSCLIGYAMWSAW